MNRLSRTFEALSSRNYRLFVGGQAVSVAGTWMQKVAQAWLVLELTGSGTLLGVTAALQHLPTLLVGPWGGLFADRVDRRRILLWTQSVAGVLALILGILVVTDLVALWMVIALALALGVTESLDKPARQTFVLDMVGPARLTNALALNSVLMNSGRVLGPAAAGILIGFVGLGASFLVNAASYLAVVAALGAIRPAELEPVEPVARGRSQLREGMRYILRTPRLLGPLVLMAVTGMLAYEWIVTLPLLATDAFGGDAQEFGLLFSAMGLGAVVGGLLLAGTLRATHATMVISAAALGVLMTITALAPSLEVALVMLVFVGGASIAFRTVATTVIQLNCEPHMRGRVMAMAIVAIGGTTPVGAPLVGWIADQFGARIAFGQGGVASVLAAVAAWAYLRLRTEHDLSSSSEDAPAVEAARG
jgi:MFS family permease